ncbi:siderophore-interacting protein [Frateuria aurantia]
MSTPEFRMIRLPLTKRTLTVARTERLSPHMQRVVLTGPELDGFQSPAPDDHIKLFFPNSHGQMVLPELSEQGPVYPQGQEPSPARDYTPRTFDPQTRELTIDFVLHGDGPATSWAAHAKPGSTLTIAGPRGSAVLEGMAPAGLILAGDETALPAIGRWLDEAPEGAAIRVLIEIPEAADQLPLKTATGIAVQWLVRGDKAPGQCLREAVAGLTVEAEQHVYWIACDSASTRQIRMDLEARGVPRQLIKAKGYWKRDGEA